MVHLPEVVELAVVITGLGMPRNRISLVKQTSSYWDSTVWDAFPRPFLDTQCLAYSNALAAWVRGDRSPSWVNEFESEIKKPMMKSLKFLFKTDDSFFNPVKVEVIDQTQAFWLEMSATGFASSQIVAVRNFEKNEPLEADQTDRLLANLRSSNRDLILHSISAIEDLQLIDGRINEELKLLLDDRELEVQAKAIIALTKLSDVDDEVVSFAVKMMDNNAQFLRFAAMIALGSRSTIQTEAMKAVDRAFCRSLQSCDYDFVGVFAAAYFKWLSDPKQHVTNVLEDGHEEYMDIAIEAIENAKEQFVALN